MSLALVTVYEKCIAESTAIRREIEDLTRSLSTTVSSTERFAKEKRLTSLQQKLVSRTIS